MVDLEIVASHREQSHTSMARAWEHLEAGDLHQASEKGWGAAPHMGKAMAEGGVDWVVGGVNCGGS